MKTKVPFNSFLTTMTVCLLLATSIKFSHSSNQVTKLLRNQKNEQEGSKTNQQIHDKSPISASLVDNAMDAHQKDREMFDGRDFNLQTPKRRYPEYGRQLRWQGDLESMKRIPKHHAIKRPKVFDHWKQLKVPKQTRPDKKWSGDCGKIRKKDKCDHSKLCYWNDATVMCLDLEVSEPCDNFESQPECDRLVDCNWDDSFGDCIEKHGTDIDCCEVKSQGKCQQLPKCSWVEDREKCISPDDVGIGCDEVNEERVCNHADGCTWVEQMNEEGTCMDVFNQCSDIENENDCTADQIPGEPCFWDTTSDPNNPQCRAAAQCSEIDIEDQCTADQFDGEPCFWDTSDPNNPECRAAAECSDIDSEDQCTTDQFDGEPCFWDTTSDPDNPECRGATQCSEIESRDPCTGEIDGVACVWDGGNDECINKPDTCTEIGMNEELCNSKQIKDLECFFTTGFTNDFCTACMELNGFCIEARCNFENGSCVTKPCDTIDNADDCKANNPQCVWDGSNCGDRPDDCTTIMIPNVCVQSGCQIENDNCVE